MPTIDNDTTRAVPRLRPLVRVRNFRGKLLVAGATAAVELSETAAFIYDAIDGERTVTDLGARVADEYDVPLEVAVTDVAELVAELSEADLIDLA